MTNILAAAIVSLGASLIAERLVEPAVTSLHERSWAATGVHVGLWLLAFALLTTILQRPWLAATVVVSLYLVLIQSNRAKWHALREPFVHQDLEYFLDAIRHPRLYVPFFGLWLAAGASTAGAVAIAAFFYFEPTIGQAGLWPRDMAIIALIATLACLLLCLASSRLPPPPLNPAEDLARTGLLAHLWRYGRRARRVPPPDDRSSPFSQPTTSAGRDELPHIVAVQSESFFDARRWSSAVEPDVLANWDALCRDAIAYGPLTVPAWGANTVRTEAAFLTGFDAAALDIHRFNPYALFARHPVTSLVGHVRSLGYRSVAVHPYPASFYARSRVFAQLGFDEFIDGSHFRNAPRCGPYVSDDAVTDQVVSLIEAASGPLFIFVITMENHGPLHLERIGSGAFEFTGTQPASQPRLPPDGGDLAVYLRHLRHADRMIARLQAALADSERPGQLCWYGDHVPSMAGIYETLGYPDGRTDYALWETPARSTREGNVPRKAEELGVALHRLGLGGSGRADAAAERAARSASRGV